MASSIGTFVRPLNSRLQFPKSGPLRLSAASPSIAHFSGRDPQRKYRFIFHVMSSATCSSACAHDLNFTLYNLHAIILCMRSHLTIVGASQRADTSLVLVVVPPLALLIPRFLVLLWIVLLGVLSLVTVGSTSGRYGSLLRWWSTI